MAQEIVGKIIFSKEEKEKFKDAFRQIRLTDSSIKYNEVLARGKFTPDGKSSIIIGSSHLEARLLAQERARIILQFMKMQAAEKNQDWDELYLVPIYFYRAELEVYDVFEQAKDRGDALTIFLNKKRRDEKYKEKKYEFLLALSDTDFIIDAVDHKDKFLLKKIADNRFTSIVLSILDKSSNKTIAAVFNKIFQSLHNLSNNKHVIDLVLQRLGMASAFELFDSEQNKVKLLHWIIQHGYLPRFQEIQNTSHYHHLIEKYGPSFKNELFIKAVKFGRYVLVSDMLKEEKSIECKNLALFEAADQGHLDVLELLLAHGAQADCKNGSITPLQKAVQSGKSEIVKHLLEVTKVELNTHDDAGNTILHEAIKGQNQFLIEFLLEKGADATIKNRKGETALRVAIKNFVNKDIVLKILKNIKVVSDEDKTATLLWAVKWKHNEIVKDLIKTGVFLNSKNEENKTALHIALVNLNYDMAKLLIVNGAEPNVENNHGLTPLHYAAMYGQLDIVNLLIQYGADINALDEENYTPLHYATSHLRPDVVKALIKNGAKVDIVNKQGNTALDLARKRTQWDANNIINKQLFLYLQKITENDSKSTAMTLALPLTASYLAFKTMYSKKYSKKSHPMWRSSSSQSQTHGTKADLVKKCRFPLRRRLYLKIH